MNIDKEYNNLQKILNRKNNEYEKESAKISKRIAIERNKIKHGSVQKQPNYPRQRPLYSNKSQPKYQRPPHNSQNRYEDESNKIILSLGVVGEQVGSTSARRGAKGNSLDMKLPKIGDGIHKEKDKIIKGHQNSINSIKLPTLQKYKHGKYYANNDKIYPNKYSKSSPKKSMKSYRYKYTSKQPKELYKSKKTIDRLKMYKN